MTRHGRPAPDMLFRDVRYRHRLELPILGVPTVFEADSASLVDRAEEAFGAWRALDGRSELIAANGVRVRLALQDDDEADAGTAPVRYRVTESGRLVLATPGSQGFADPAAREAYLWATPTLVADAAHFRFSVLSALTLFLVTFDDRRPVHAAALAGPTSALLLHGPSGVGKSTLTMACALRGLTVLAEDVVYAQVEPSLRVWGMPGPLHLGEDAIRFFPGAATGGSTVRSAGESKLALPLPVGPVDPTPVRSRAGIVLLRASTGAPSIERASEAEVHQAVGRPDEPGFDLFQGRMDEVARLVARGGAWRLHLGTDPHRAAAAVESLLEEVERNA